MLKIKNDFNTVKWWQFPMLIVAGIVNATGVALFLLSFLLDVPASACIVLVNLAAYLLFSLAGWAASQSGKRKTMRSRRETNG